jgi:hypothetical protein
MCSEAYADQIYKKTQSSQATPSWLDAAESDITGNYIFMQCVSNYVTLDQVEVCKGSFQKSKMSFQNSMAGVARPSQFVMPAKLPYMMRALMKRKMKMMTSHKC